MANSLIQKILFTKGMNLDDSNERLSEGEGRTRVDVRVLWSNIDQNLACETALGNSPVAYDLPDGDNKVIGTKEYKLTGNIYYFVWNSNKKHQILQYNIASNTVTKVIQEAATAPYILNFQLDYLITGIVIIELNKDNHLLYWTDNYIDPTNPNVYNEPRKINIEKAIAFSAGDFVNGYTSPFNPLWAYRIKQPPLFPPTYVWTGIGAITPVVKFTATSTIPVGISGHSSGNVAFNVDPFSPGDGYDTTTYIWTSDVNAVTNITTTNTFDFAVSGQWIVRLYINGAPLPVNDRYYGPFTAPPTFQTITSDFPNILLNIGDTIQIVVENGLSGSITVRDGSFSASAVPANSSAKVNHLYKKLFQFKVKYVYDDFEESAWSPISKYVFPQTTNGGGSGEDIALQDTTIILTVPTGSSIVKRIKIAAKNVDQLDFYQIADLDKLDLGIADDTSYNYTFTDYGGAIPLDTVNSINLFDRVPLAAKGEEAAAQRVMDANITEGQDPVSIDMKMNLTYELVDVYTNSWFPKTSYLKTGGEYDIVIVYYDKPGNRSGLANATPGLFDVQNDSGKYGTTLYVPFLTDPNYNAPHGTPNLDMSYVPRVHVEIFNSPPAWATHYQVLRSKNQSIGRYLQFAADHFVFDNAGPVKYSLQIFLYNITGPFKDENPASHLVYDFVPGDRVRFIANVIYATGVAGISNEITAFYPYIDVPIASYDSGTGAITIAVTAEVPANVAPGTLIEIYQPNNVIDEKTELVYEIGECYEIGTDANGNLIHQGPEENQVITTYTGSSIVGSTATITGIVGPGVITGASVEIQTALGVTIAYGTVTLGVGTTATINITSRVPGSLTGGGIIIVAAKIQLRGGDTFRRLRNMPFNSVPGPLVRLYSYIEDAQVSDVFISPADDIGRPNRIDDNFTRITRPTTILWSEQFIPETFINGLSTVYDTSFQTYDSKFGSIQKIYNENFRLIVYHELKIGQIPVHQIIYNDTTGDQAVGTSIEVLSPQMIYYAGEYGIGKNPESFHVYGNAKYNIDVPRGMWLRLSNDGITPISLNAKMHNHLTSLCQKIIDSGKQVNIYGVFDVSFMESILAFEGFTYLKMVSSSPPVYIPVIVPGETLAFNEDANMFSTFYSYKPEFMSGCGNSMVSFKDGALWIHNQNPLIANYYGVQYKPKVSAYCNIFPSNQKIYIAIAQESDSPWDTTIETPSGQRSILISNNFVLREGFMYSEFKRDINTPNVANPVIQGDVMRGQTALITLEYPGTTYNKLYAFNILFAPSNRSNE